MNESEVSEIFINTIIFFLIIIIAIISFIFSSLNFGAVIIFISLIIYFAHRCWEKYRCWEKIRNRTNLPIVEFNEQNIESVRAQMEYYKILDSRLQQRENYVLVAESMLLFSIVTALTSLPPNYIISRVIAIAGIVITFLWYLANLRILIQSDSVLNEYLFQGFIKRSIISVRNQPSGKLLLHDILPGSIFILWIYLLIYSHYQINVNDFAIELLPYCLLGLLGFRLIVKVLLPRNISNDSV